MEDSDIDILIIADSEKRPVDRFVEVKRLLYDHCNRIPISPIFLTPAEITKRIKEGDDFTAGILLSGEVLYDSTQL